MKKRPYLIHFIAILAEKRISVKIAIGTKDSGINDADALLPTALDGLYMFNKSTYRIKLQAFSDDKLIGSREYESDSFGSFNFKFPSSVNDKKITRLKVYEIGSNEGVEFMLGEFKPYEIHNPKKILISDFDKTIVDTRYSTPKELYYSLSRPVDHYPRIEKSYDMIQEFIKNSYQPFILSASPHFYENAISSWLKRNNIQDAPVFLKDYRNFVSFRSGVFSRKDFKEQGFYKLDQLVNILLMSTIPNELILMGDCFESDELIYLTLSAILLGRMDAWNIWDKLKHNKNFSLTGKQNSIFLSKLYKLNEKAKDAKPEIKIFIRYKEESQLASLKERSHPISTLNELKSLITYY